MKKFKIIFFGSDSFAVSILENLATTFQVALVITKTDKATGRGQKLSANPVKIAAEKLNLPLLSLDKIDQKTVEKINKLEADVYLVAAFGLMIPNSLLVSPKGIKTVNIHPSLLPKFRGPSPIESAILSGDKYTGVSIMVLDEKMDHGGILAQEREIIDDEFDDFISLSERLEKRAANLLKKILADYIEGRIKPKAQEHNKATYTKMITKPDGQIDFTKDALNVLRHIRAFAHWPGSFASWKEKGKQIKIIEARMQHVLPEPPLTAGLVFKTATNKPAVVCGKDAIVIETIQIEGKKPTDVVSFINGYPDFIGSNLG